MSEYQSPFANKIMSSLVRLFQTIAVIGLAMSGVASASAESQTRHVFELFTSQGCYSCPPADKLLGRIIDKHENVLALEFHVDYWDTLVYGSAGQWKDPFSSSLFSQRQRDYNRLALDGRKGVYTPQMIVDGSYAFVGSNAFYAQRQLNKDTRLILDISARVSDNKTVTVTVGGDYADSAQVWLINFDKKHVTQVSAGENMGKKMTNWNVVRNLEVIGNWQGESLTLEKNIEPLQENQGCAVIVQKFDESRQRVAGPILGAATCQST